MNDEENKNTLKKLLGTRSLKDFEIPLTEVTDPAQVIRQLTDAPSNQELQRAADILRHNGYKVSKRKKKIEFQFKLRIGDQEYVINEQSLFIYSHGKIYILIPERQINCFPTLSERKIQKISKYNRVKFTGNDSVYSFTLEIKDNEF